MATLTPTLTLTSSDTSSDALALTVTDSLTVKNPQIGPSRKAANAKRRTKIDLRVVLLYKTERGRSKVRISG